MLCSGTTCQTSSLSAAQRQLNEHSQGSFGHETIGVSGAGGAGGAGGRVQYQELGEELPIGIKNGTFDVSDPSEHGFGWHVRGDSEIVDGRSHAP